MVVSALKKQLYFLNLKRYNKGLEQYLEKQYGFAIDYLNSYSWGYSTTAFYLKTDRGDFTARLTPYSEKTQITINRDIAVCNELITKLPVSNYVKDNAGSYTSLYDSRIVRVNKHIEGVAPFDMQLGIFAQIIAMLGCIHHQIITDIQLPSISCENQVLLHGDPTPSNFLISHGKLVGVVDFEEALYGPAEYDIAYACLFCWMRANEISIKDFVTTGIEVYEGLNEQMLKEFIVIHGEKHSENIKQHKEHYKNLKDYEQDIELFERKLNLLRFQL